MRHSGIWTLETEPMYREYLFVESCDAISLNDAISKLSFNIELVGASSSSITPIDDDIRKWLTYAMDESHTIRASIASIANGTLHVCSGPLVGQESRIIKIDRHKRSCSVLISDHNGGFAERFALNVPVKS